MNTYRIYKITPHSVVLCTMVARGYSPTDALQRRVSETNITSKVYYHDGGEYIVIPDGTGDGRRLKLTAGNLTVVPA